MHVALHELDSYFIFLLENSIPRLLCSPTAYFPSKILQVHFFMVIIRRFILKINLKRKTFKSPSNYNHLVKRSCLPSLKSLHWRVVIEKDTPNYWHETSYIYGTLRAIWLLNLIYLHAWALWRQKPSHLKMIFKKYRHYVIKLYTVGFSNKRKVSHLFWCY